MHRALLTVIFAGFVASSHADPGNSPSVIALEANSRIQLQPAPEVVKTIATRNEIPVRGTPAASAYKKQAEPGHTRASTYGTLLATLVLMVAIAVRRLRSGTP